MGVKLLYFFSDGCKIILIRMHLRTGWPNVAAMNRNRPIVVFRTGI